jgi:very-short-patch-repair endonuclease
MNKSSTLQDTSVSDRLSGLLEYVEHMARLTEKTIFSIREHKNLCYFEHQLQGRIGVHHDIMDDAGPVWLKIDRLQRIDPPEVPEALRPWLIVGRDPERYPQVHQLRMETMHAREGAAFVATGVVAEDDVVPALKQSPFGSNMVDVTLRLDRLPEVREAVERYLEGPWKTWSEAEKPRRETIAIYERFFSLKQAIQSEGTEHPIELVWGAGIAVWKPDGPTIEHPLIEALVEIELEERTGAVLVRPRHVPPQLGLKPFHALNNDGADLVERLARDHFSRLEREDKDFSPFIRETFEPVLRQGAAQLHASAVYHSDEVADKTDRSLPVPGPVLRITDSWVLYARRRSDNVFVDDLRRLRGAVQATPLGDIPAAAQRLVTELPNMKVYRTTLLNFGSGYRQSSANSRRNVIYGGNASGMGSEQDTPPMLETTAFEEEDLTNTHALFFPKEFNEAQVAIIRRLEHSDGVVVQGPPGTGKTHTIANIICHCLAHGQRVLVTSKGEPALTVLREHIPEGIRDLCISLLTSEREGLRQLERAVRTLANTVVTLRPGAIEREIVDKQTEVDELRKRIAQIETEMSDWARKQLSRVDAAIAGELQDVTPTQLAERVVAGLEQHRWFPDHLTTDHTSMPQFTDADIASIRDARRRLGADLKWAYCVIPSPNDLPDAASLAAVHEDLVHAEQLQRVAQDESIPPLALSVDRALDRADETRTALLELIEHRRAMVAEAWFEKLFVLWYREGFESSETDLFNNLLEDIADIAKRRHEFLSRPVTVPALGSYRDALVAAVERASRGARPFGLLPLGKSAVRTLLEKIAIVGQRPVSTDDWKHVAAFFRYQTDIAKLITRWNNISSEFGLPTLSADLAQSARALADCQRLVERARRVLNALGPHVKAELTALFPHGVRVEAVMLDIEAAEKALQALEFNLSRYRLSRSHGRIEAVRAYLATHSGDIVEAIRQFLTEKLGNPGIRTFEVIEQWNDLITELRRILDLRPLLEEVARVVRLVQASGAPNWAKALATEPVEGVDDPWTPANWSESWIWARQRSFLQEIDGRERLKLLAAERLTLDADLKRLLAEVVKLRTFLGLKVNMTERIAGALSRFMTHIANIGAGTGVRARRYRRDARTAMEECYAGVPCWIMPTWRVSEHFPAALGAFDLVIVDEASQSDVTALPALLRGKKLLIVGDDKQVSPTAPFVEEKKLLQLRHNFLGDQPHQSLLLPGSSLFDLANAIFPGRRVMLQEHFRCVESIIRFSFQFYTEDIIPLRVPKASERLDPPLIDVYLPHGVRSGHKVNATEAYAIVDEIASLVQDPAYASRSIGVVSLIGSEQAALIQRLLLERIGEQEFLEHRIECGDSATFQGKERDIMFISMVASPGQAVAQTSRVFQQRFNVALSRARDRMYLFRSVEERDLNPADLKAKVIAHFWAPMVLPDARAGVLIDRCESEFERAVFRRLVALGYRVTPQVAAGPFRIDMVVEGVHDRRLAVELDGDRFHGPERWAEDMARQRILERVGWRFWRCWASSFTLDPDGCIQDLIEALQSRGIEPIGSTEQQTVYTQHRIISTDSPSYHAITSRHIVPSLMPEPVVQVGDRILIAYSDEPSRQRTLMVSASDHDPDLGIVSVSDPHAQALLGKAENEEVELTTAQGPRTVTVLAIERARDSATASVPTVPLVRQADAITPQTELLTSQAPDRAPSLSRAIPSVSSVPTAIHRPSTTVSVSGILPYRIWPPSPLLNPRSSAPSDLVPGLLDIVSVEGPILSRRLFRLYARAAGISLGQGVVSALSRALEQTIREGLLVAEADRVIDGIQQQVLRTPEQPPVMLRERGDRSLDDIPLTEIAEAITYVKSQRGLTIEDEIFRSCLSLFGLSFTKRARQVLEAAWRVAGLE